MKAIADTMYPACIKSSFVMVTVWERMLAEPTVSRDL